MQSTELIWTLISFFLTLLIFSYIFGDNPFFRLTSYLFVGVTSGYFLTLIIYQVLIPRLWTPLFEGSLLERGLTLIPLILGLLLLMKVFPRYSKLGNIPMAYLVGVGAAVTIGGAVLGTIAGQISGTIDIFDFTTQASLENNPFSQLFNGGVILLGTISTLVYFQFSTVSNKDGSGERSTWIEWVAKIGQLFIAITLGALFAGVLIAALSALIERLDFLQRVITGFFY
ncbi:MAG: hypothetical protein JEZ06_10120 [Anaerolineaceae bacterium]|nr:hypothetical protein [Anaerolineaceae bacterium]